MRRVRYSVAMSLDGFIADPQGGYDWIIVDPAIDFNAMFAAYDVVLMGRKSYDMAKQPGGYGMPLKTAYVFSRTLQQADCPDATVSDDPEKIVKKLKKTGGGKDIWLFGGGELFKSMLELRLVDAIEVAVIPVLLGAGLPLLPKTDMRANLKLTSHKLYQKTGTLLLNYDVKYTRRVATVGGC